ncbi:MmyB family transcriptional regulator [Kibdelosporangium aridum]|uniref:MmyB family transcriptional regulator n=1 Tax=Kibdelosporangium aridum TaxID=2030 RepID=UPI0035EC0E01
MPDSRRELGVFLRSRRARLAPADVGLPRTGRRRTAGPAPGGTRAARRDERDHLFHLAGQAPAPSVQERLTPEVAAVPGLLQPNPAYIIDATYDVLSHNQAADDLFPNLLSDRRANFVRWVFAEPVAKEVLIDWEPEARGLLARLRTLSGREPAGFAYTAFHLAEQPDQTLVIYSDAGAQPDTEEDQGRPGAIPSAYEW